MKKKKIIILSILVIFIIAMICGVIWYFNNRNSNYKPNGKLNYDTVLVNEETNPYYQVGFADYVFIGKVDKEIERYIISLGALISQDTIENAIAFCLFGELYQVLVRDRKDFQFLAGLDHIGEPCLAFGLLFLLQHGHEKQGDILCRRACKFCGNFKAFKREPDDLLSRITAVVHSCGSPFVLIFLPLLGLHPPFPR